MNRLVVKVTCGADQLERCVQGLTVAATAVASGVEVAVWLTGEGTRIALPGHAESLVLEHSAPLADLRDAILEGGSLTVCTQCAARRGINAEDVLPGVRIAGSSSYVELVVTDGTQALVY